MAWIKQYWTLDKPEDPNKYKGRMVRVKDDNGNYRVVEIEEVLGSLKYPTRFQVNSGGLSYLISMLDFLAQMNGETVSEEDCKEFEAAFDGAYVKKSSPILPAKTLPRWIQQKKMRQ